MRRLSLIGLATATVAPAGAQVAITTPGGAGLPEPTPLTVQSRQTMAASVRGDPSLELPVTAIDTRRAAARSGVGVAVDARRQPEFDPRPLPIGPFLLTAGARAGIGYDSNVFRLRDARGDGFVDTQVDATLATNSGRHLLAVKSVVNTRTFSRYDTENAVTYSIDAGGRLDLGLRDNVTLNAGHARQQRERAAASEIVQTRRPIRYDLTTLAGSGYKALGRVGITLSGQVERYDFDDAETPDRVEIDQDFRDNRGYTGRVNVSYALGPGPLVFVNAQTTRIKYDERVTAGVDRNSRQYLLTAGLQGDITPLIRGSIGVGYVTAKVGSLPRQSGPTIDAALQYLVTELTTISLVTNRSFQNVGSVTTPLTLNTQIGVRVAHELLRNLILSAGVTHDTYDYVNDNGGSHAWQLRSGAEMSLNRHLRLTAAVGYRDRVGFGRQAERRYNQYTTTLGVSARF